MLEIFVGVIAVCLVLWTIVGVFAWIWSWSVLKTTKALADELTDLEREKYKL